MFSGYRRVVGSPTDIAELSGERLPFRPVTGPRACEGVGDLVEEHLVNVVVFGCGGEVARDTDFPLLVVARAKTSFCVVKSKRPTRFQV